MIYTERKERSHRFKLALRMGLPIFFLSVLALYTLLTTPETTIATVVFYLLLILAAAVYFIFYLIYQSNDEHITDSTTHTFTPDYFFKLSRKWKREGTTTVVMISVDNLITINERYGVKNGDKTMNKVLVDINDFFAARGIKKLPICRYKGGDFLLLFKGGKSKYRPFVELFLTKFEESMMDEIEIKLTAVILDTEYVNKEEEIVTRLYELKNAHKSDEEDTISAEKLESAILDAIAHQRYSIGIQSVKNGEDPLYETSIKLLDKDNALIHQSRFVPFLNRVGKMRLLETDLLDRIVMQAKEDGKHYCITLSGVTLRNGIFFQHALELLELHPEAKEKIILMIEEKEYSSHLKRFKEQIAQYRSVGYKIALDNYGNNHTTLMYLKEFEVDFIRFDSLYTRHLKEERYQNIVHGLNITAHLCGAQTWIAKIEDEESDMLAKHLKINLRQGNYHGKITVLETITKGTV